MSIQTTAPSAKIYGQMQKAFDFFNERLFEGKLPQVILSLHRHPNTIGYFIPEKYRAKTPLGDFDDSPDTLDEIALNPDMLMIRSDKQILSTLVHEMCHLWIEHFSIAPRRGHHCKRWAAKMKKVGLYPSSTASVGGKETGSRVSHYIIDGGPFDALADKLLEDGFAFTWGSVAHEARKSKKAGKRAKYVCPSCGAALWGKGGLLITCDPCAENFIYDDPREDGSEEDFD